MNNKTESSYKCSGSNKEKISRGSSISQGRQLVDHKSSIPQENHHSHLLPIRDFYPNNENNKRKYMSYSTSITWGS